MKLVTPIEENYNVILVRYSEVALKSPKVRSRMENRLLFHITEICNRENIALGKGERNWGRLLFYFSPTEIVKALKIFPFIIGVHSFSAGISLETDYNVIKPIALQFASLYFHKGDKFAFRARRVKPYPKNSIEIEHDIGGEISAEFERKGEPLIVDLKSPDKTLFLEIRQDIAFLYTEEQYTNWGGNPIEFDKAMFALDFGKEKDLVAMQLDIGNLYNGGAKALDVMNQYPGRFEIIHVKDEIEATGGNEKYESTILGEGIVNARQVIELAATKGGTNCFIIEQESYGDLTPMDCVKKDLEIMNAWGY